MNENSDKRFHRGDHVEWRTHGLVIIATVTAASGKGHPGQLRLSYYNTAFRRDMSEWVRVEELKPYVPKPGTPVTGDNPRLMNARDMGGLHMNGYAHRFPDDHLDYLKRSAKDGVFAVSTDKHFAITKQRTPDGDRRYTLHHDLNGHQSSTLTLSEAEMREMVGMCQLFLSFQSTEHAQNCACPRCRCYRQDNPPYPAGHPLDGVW